MKSTLLVLIFLSLLACHEEENTPSKPINDTFDTSKATLLKQGMLTGVGHTVSGTASLYDASGTIVVVLDPYSSQNGPDLKVYFSVDADASSYIKLGQLKSISGKQSYEVPAGSDVSNFHYVHIWCEKFTVVFGIAELK